MPVEKLPVPCEVFARGEDPLLLRDASWSPRAFYSALPVWQGEELWARDGKVSRQP